MNTRCLASAVALSVVFATGAFAQTRFFDFVLDGEQHVPGVSTLAFGFGTLEYDATLMTFDLDLAVVGISLADLMPDAGHINNGARFFNGPSVFQLSTLGTFTEEPGGLIRLLLNDVPIGSATNAQLLQGGNLYLNVRTIANPTGELRGQIIAIPAPSLVAFALPVAIIASRRRRLV